MDEGGEEEGGVKLDLGGEGAARGCAEGARGELAEVLEVLEGRDGVSKAHDGHEGSETYATEVLVPGASVGVAARGQLD